MLALILIMHQKTHKKGTSSINGAHHNRKHMMKMNDNQI